MEIERGACVLDVAAMVARLANEDMLRLWAAAGAVAAVAAEGRERASRADAAF